MKGLPLSVLPYEITVSAYSVPGTGEKEKSVMKKKIIYEKAPDGIDETIITSKLIEDILPPPDKLVKKEETVKVTISLSQKSVNFVKKKADRGYLSALPAIYSDYLVRKIIGLSHNPRLSSEVVSFQTTSENWSF